MSLSALQLVDWSGRLTSPPPPAPAPQPPSEVASCAPHRACFTEAEGRRLLAQLEACSEWITAHGGDFDKIVQAARS